MSSRALVQHWLGPGLCVLALACAPAQSFRPGSALQAGTQGEVGIALASVGARPYVAESARPVAQGWWSARVGRRWQSSVVLGFDQSAVLAGGALRFLMLQKRVSLAAEAELGFAWAAVSLPAAVELWQPLTLYCSPRLGNWGAALTGFLPCGLNVEVGGRLALRGEVQLSWADFAYYNRRAHAGLALVQQW